ncbi:MAG TPA: ATP phosphoribosyltransferase [Rhizomicrobium sp.]|jgi:ATP phosphoribosyltransferase
MVNNAPLTLAVPSKGRLQEHVLAYFADAGLPMRQTRGGRGYRATLEGLPDIDVHLLSASEIASALLAGEVHMGITGEDLLRESANVLDGQIALFKALGFGFANVVVAVPQAWIDVSDMNDLDDVCAAFFQRHRRRLRIATKYVNLTRAFFAKTGIADYRIVESAGATEGAPASGSAEAIVDITTTGATLAANGLKTLADGTILESQAQLAASLSAIWSEKARDAATRLVTRLAARERATSSLVLRARFDGDAAGALARLSGEPRVSLLSRPAEGHGEAAFVCPRDLLMQTIAVLREEGANGAITAQDADYIFDGGEPLIARLEQMLPLKG